MLKKVIAGYCRLLSVLMVISLVIMVVLVFGNVVLRYGFNSGFTISEELSRWLFVWMTFLGAVVVLNERSHLGTDTVISRLPLRGKKICFGISYALMLLMCWMVFRGAWEQTKINIPTVSAVMEASMGLFYLTGVVFAVLAAPILLLQLWQLVTGQLSESELVGIVESEEVPHGDPVTSNAASK